MRGPLLPALLAATLGAQGPLPPEGGRAILTATRGATHWALVSRSHPLIQRLEREPPLEKRLFTSFPRPVTLFSSEDAGRTWRALATAPQLDTMFWRRMVPLEDGRMLLQGPFGFKYGGRHASFGFLDPRQGPLQLEPTGLPEDVEHAMAGARLVEVPGALLLLEPQSGACLRISLQDGSLQGMGRLWGERKPISRRLLHAAPRPDGRVLLTSADGWSVAPGDAGELVNLLEFVKGRPGAEHLRRAWSQARSGPIPVAPPSGVRWWVLEPATGALTEVAPPKDGPATRYEGFEVASDGSLRWPAPPLRRAMTPGWPLRLLQALLPSRHRDPRLKVEELRRAMEKMPKTERRPR